MRLGGTDGEDQQPPEQRVVLRARIAVLEVGAASAADEQRIAGEHPVGHDEAVGIVRVPGRIERFEAQALDVDPIAVADTDGDDLGLALLPHHRDAARALAERLKSRDVVGMEMRVDGFHQPQVELAQKLDIAVDPFEDRIDDERLSAMAACQEIGVGARGAIVELPENHVRSRSVAVPTQGGSKEM